MNALRTESIKRVFVLTADDLSAINDGVRDFLRSNARVSYELICIDKMERHPADVRQIQEYENARDRAIKRIEIRGTSEDFKRRCSITLSDDTFWTNVRISADGGEGAVGTLFDSMQRQLIAMSPWYARLAMLDFVAIILFLLMLFWGGVIVLGIAYDIHRGIFSVARLLRPPDIGLGPLILAMIVLVMLGGLFNLIRGRVFPLAVFAIGQGLKRHQENDRWRWLLVGTVLIGGLVSLVVNLITRH